MICPGRPWPADPQDARNLLLSWLQSGQDSGEQILDSEATEDTVQSPAAPSAAGQQAVQMFYGNPGKRQAVEAFLTGVCLLSPAPPLLLYSNEEFDWLYEDPAFARKWAALMMRCAQNGSRIRIIHTISRDANEMLVALQKWMPLYTSGAIESYFYPKLRDQVYRRSLFVAPGHAAVLSTSVEKHTEAALNMLITDAEAVAALEQEFNDFFRLCKPLMQVFTLQNRENLGEKLEAFGNIKGNLIAAESSLSPYTMPESLIKSVYDRCGSAFARYHRAARKSFLENLRLGYQVTEVLQLPDIHSVRSGLVPFPMCDLYGEPGLRYTMKEFCAHLNEMIRLLRTCPGYHVSVISELPQGLLLFAKEDLAAFVVSSAQPSSVFGLSEPRMVSAIGDMAERLSARARGGRSAAEFLTQYLHAVLTA